MHDELTSLPFPYRLEDEDDDEEGEEGTARRVKFEDVLRVLEPEEIDEIDGKKLKADIAFLEGEFVASQLPREAELNKDEFTERLEKNTADLAVLQEYRRRNEEFRKRAEEFAAVSQLWDAAKNSVMELRNQRLVQFMQGFGIISNKLKEMYQVRYSFYRAVVDCPDIESLAR